jgi:hypothetical protein
VNQIHFRIDQDVGIYNAECEPWTFEKTPDQTYFGIEALPKAA